MPDEVPVSRRAPAQSISRHAGLALVVLAVLARSIIILGWEDQYFDADQAVMGLMARHVAEGRAFPVFQYGAPYVLMIEAWLTAPLMLIDGSSVALVKAVPVALNVVTAALLYWMLSGAGLRPAYSLLATLPVAFVGVGAANELTAALGMSIEPLLFALVIWLLRERPVALGIVAAVAIRNREFALYAVASLLALDLLRDRSAAFWRPRLLALVAFGLTWSAIGVLIQYGSSMGPGTTMMASAAGDPDGNVAVAASAVCFVPARIPDDLRTVSAELLPFLFGLRSVRWQASGHPGNAPPDASWLWVPLVVLVVGGTIRGLVSAWRGAPTHVTWLAMFLIATGLQSVIVYASTRCGHASVFTLRYMLLALFVPVGALALSLDRGPGRVVRGLSAGVCLLWVAVCAAGHVAVVRGFVADPPVSRYRQLATYLEQQGAEYLVSDYWIGYHVAFLTGERVKAATDFTRIHEHALAVDANRDRTWQVSRRPEGSCGDAVRIGDLYVCPPATR